jgi:hypothetical protein
MPAFEFSFDATAYTPQYGASGSLPPGKHPVMIVDIERLAISDPTKGSFLALTLEAIDGPAKGSKQVDRLNLWHVSPETAEISNKQLSAYCYVTGAIKFRSPQELMRRPFVVEIAAQKNRPDYTEVVALYSSDMRKPGEIAAAGGAPAQAKAPPAIPAAEQVIEQPKAAPAQAWGAPAAGGAPAPWGAPAA